MSGVEFLVALVIALGLVGVLVPLMPGTPLVAAAIAAWAIGEGDRGWRVFAVAATLMAVGAVVKYLVPARSLRRSGIPRRTLLIGGAVGVVGFFVVPVVGLPLGFVLGIYLAEWHRLSPGAAGPATVGALKAIGLGILIELVATTLAALVWLIGALNT